MVFNNLAVSRQPHEQFTFFNSPKSRLPGAPGGAELSHDLQAALVPIQLHLELVQLLDLAVVPLRFVAYQ